MRNALLDWSTLSPATCSAAFRVGRAFASLTQEEVASKLGVNRIALMGIERRWPSDASKIVQRAWEVFGRFGVTVDEDDAEGVIVWTRGIDGKSVALHRVLAAARAGADMSQERMAQVAGVSPRTIANIESGRDALPSVRTAIMQALHRRRIEVVSEDEFVGIAVRSERAYPRPLAEGASVDDDFHAKMKRHFAVMKDGDHPAFVRYRVEIERTRPSIWRELLIPENATFRDLHMAIQAAFGWRGSHLYKFELGLEVGPPELNDNGPISDGRVLDDRLVWLYDVSPDVDFRYVYDFGDNWVHRVVRGESEGRNGRPLRPVVLDGELAGPVEDSHGPHGYNEIADLLREGKLDRDRRDWLRFRGYGARFDPDRFDIASCNAALAEMDFDIPGTWESQAKRRKSVVVTAPFLERREQAAKKASTKERPAVEFKFIGVKPFGEKAFRRDGVGKDIGYGLHIDWKRDRQVALPWNALGINPLLVIAPDIRTYEGFPVKVIYEVGGKRKTLFVDLRVEYVDGSIQFVHFLSEDDIPDLPTYRLLAEAIARSGHEIEFVGTGCFVDPQVLTAQWIDRMKMAPEDPEIESALSEIFKRKAKMASDQVVDALLEKGFASENWQGVVGGDPRPRVIARLTAAIAAGIASVDMGAGSIEESTIGRPRTFDATAMAKPFFARWRGL